MKTFKEKFGKPQKFQPSAIQCYSYIINNYIGYTNLTLEHYTTTHFTDSTVEEFLADIF